MLSVSYAGKNAYSAGKTNGVLRGSASGANRCYVLAHCGEGGAKQWENKVVASQPPYSDQLYLLPIDVFGAETKHL